jgi:hypothetical protein
MRWAHIADTPFQLHHFLVISPGTADDGSMAAVAQFVVTFRDAEVGRYETAERAMAAARSVIDTELASRGAEDREPEEMPRIEWQPPPVPFPFDAIGYWRHRIQSQQREAKAAASAPPTAAPTSHISLQKLGLSGDEPAPLRRQDRIQSERPPAPVASGPPQQRRAQPAPPAQQARPPWPAQSASPPPSASPPQQSAPPQSASPPPPGQSAQPAPMYGAPQWAGPTPQQPPPMHEDSQWAAPAAPTEEEPHAGKRRWFGKKRDRSE